MRSGEARLELRRSSGGYCDSLGERRQDCELWHWRGGNTFEEHLGDDPVRFSDIGNEQM